MEKTTVISISGFKNSGKGLVTNFFSNKGFQGIACADPIKAFIEIAFPFSPMHVWGDSQYREEQVEITLWRVFQHLQLFGSEAIPPFDTGWIFEVLGDVFRKYGYATQFYASVRDLCLLVGSIVEKRYGADTMIKEAVRAVERSPYRQVVISDLRYFHELEYLTNEAKSREDLKLFKIKILRNEYWANNTNPFTSNNTDKRELELMRKEDSYFDLVLDLPEGEEKALAVLEDLYQSAPWEK